MSDILRTALKGGGKITITIDMWTNGDFNLQVMEDWARLTGVRRCKIEAAEMSAAENPDGLIRAKLEELARDNFLGYEARKAVGEAEGG